MIRKRIEVKDINEIKTNGSVKLGFVAFFLSLPWCCITPAVLSLFGFLGATGAVEGLLVEAFYPLFVISIFLLGYANYLSFYIKHGSKVFRAVVLASTIGSLALWAFRLGLLQM